MLGFILDSNNDLTLDALGDIKMSDGVAAYEQHLVNTLRLQQYEYPYDITRGINWLGNVLQTSNLQVWESQVLERVSALEFVAGIEDWRYSVNNSNLEFVLTVSTDKGEITIQG